MKKKMAGSWRPSIKNKWAEFMKGKMKVSVKSKTPNKSNEVIESVTLRENEQMEMKQKQWNADEIQ